MQHRKKAISIDTLNTSNMVMTPQTNVRVSLYAGKTLIPTKNNVDIERETTEEIISRFQLSNKNIGVKRYNNGMAKSINKMNYLTRDNTTGTDYMFKDLEEDLEWQDDSLNVDRPIVERVAKFIKSNTKNDNTSNSGNVKKGENRVTMLFDEEEEEEEEEVDKEEKSREEHTNNKKGTENVHGRINNVIATSIQPSGLSNNIPQARDSVNERAQKNEDNMTPQKKQHQQVDPRQMLRMKKTKPDSAEVGSKKVKRGSTNWFNRMIKNYKWSNKNSKSKNKRKLTVGGSKENSTTDTQE